MKMRKGFTILEVIFMMAVLAIILPTIPLLIFKSSNAIKELKDTEYYANGYTQTMLVANKLWDEKNVQDLEESGKYYVLISNATNLQNPLLDCNNNYRNGHYKAKNRRKCSPKGDTVSAIGLDAGEAVSSLNLNDIDDFQGVKYRIIPKSKLTPNFKTEVDNYKPAGEETWSWLQKILSEPFDEATENTDLTNIANKYGLTYEVAQKWVKKMPTLEIETNVEFINYVKSSDTEITTKTVNNTAGETTDIKRIKVMIRDLTDKNQKTRKEITYYYYATNIGTDIPLVKVNK